MACLLTAGMIFCNPGISQAAAGNVTQPTMVDSFGITATSGTYAGSATALSIATATAPAAANLYDGTAAIVYTAGSTAATAATLTVTPQGTLGALAAQRLLGHSDPRVTMNIYTQVLDSEIDDVGLVLQKAAGF